MSEIKVWPDPVEVEVTYTPKAGETELPAHPEDFAFVALLRHHDMKRTKWIVVPEGQSLELDENARRQWLAPYLGSEWHLFAILRNEPAQSR